MDFGVISATRVNGVTCLVLTSGKIPWQRHAGMLQYAQIDWYVLVLYGGPPDDRLLHVQMMAAGEWLVGSGWDKICLMHWYEKSWPRPSKLSFRGSSGQKCAKKSLPSRMSSSCSCKWTKILTPYTNLGCPQSWE
jgi:hypothetical protein